MLHGMVGANARWKAETECSMWGRMREEPNAKELNVDTETETDRLFLSFPHLDVFFGLAALSSVFGFYGAFEGYRMESRAQMPHVRASASARCGASAREVDCKN